MKKFLLAIFVLVVPGLVFADFPITTIVQIYKLEVWPSNTGSGRYAAFISPGVPAAGCTYNNIFYVEDGPGADAAYSTLLAAVMAGKQVEVRLSECAYGPIADRVRVIVD